MKNRTLDMTEGNITGLLLKFAVPMLIGNLFSQFYSMVDTIIVGRFVGEEALAAVGITTPVILLMIAVLIGLNVGVTVILSQCFGAKDENKLRNAFANSLYLSLIVSACIAVLGVLITKPALLLMNTPEELMRGASVYLYISISTNVLQMLYYLYGSAFRALGDSRTPLYCLVVTSILNIILDLIFVIVFHLGIAGAAWATVISQGVSALLEGILLNRNFPVLRLKKEDYRLRKDIFSSIMKVAVPMALQNSFNSIGSFLIQSAVNGFGTAVIAAYSAATRIGEFAMQPMNTMGNAVSVYIGQNFGAKNRKRILEGVKKCLWIVLWMSLIVAAFLLLFGRPVAELFVEESTANYQVIVDNIVWYLRIVSMPCFFAGFAFTFEYSLRGLGDGAAPMIAGIVELIIKVGIAYTAAYAFGSVLGMWAAWPFAYAVSGMVAMLRFRYFYRNKCLNGQNTAGYSEVEKDQIR